MEPMNNAIKVLKKNEPETLEGTQEEWAQNWVWRDINCTQDTFPIERVV